MINAAAPDGAPPRRIKTVEILFADFHGSGVNSRSCAFLQSRKKEKFSYGNRTMSLFSGSRFTCCTGCENTT